MTEKKPIEKVLFFYNPHAGNGLFKSNLDYVIERCQMKGLCVVPVRAEYGNMLSRILSDIDQSEYRQIIAAGGDGTVNICVNAMIENNIRLPLSIFPAGTANDFAHFLELPPGITEMTDIALGEHLTNVDVGMVNNRAFINVAAMGMMVDVSQKTDPNLKNTLGALAYYLTGLTEVANLRPLSIKIKSREVNFEGKMYFMLVMNGASAGGFRRISPDSEIDDGKLNVIVFKKMPITEFGPLIINYLQGNHQRNKNVLHFKTEELWLESDDEFGTDVDGEAGEKMPLHFTVLPNRLQIFTVRDNMRGAIW